MLCAAEAAHKALDIAWSKNGRMDDGMNGRRAGGKKKKKGGKNAYGQQLHGKVLFDLTPLTSLGMSTALRESQTHKEQIFPGAGRRKPELLEFSLE